MDKDIRVWKKAHGFTINNKRVNDNNEIVNITPDNIKSISVIQVPGVQNMMPR